MSFAAYKNCLIFTKHSQLETVSEMARENLFHFSTV